MSNLRILLFSLTFVLISVSPFTLEKYSTAVEKIVNLTNTEYKGLAYKRVANLVDNFGPRLFGSDALELAIKDIQIMLINDGFEKVRLEDIPDVDRWIRGKESLTLFEPRPFPTNIPMIGLGLTVSGNVKAEVVVYKDIDDLEKNPSLAKDKIVLFNTIFTTYEETVKSRALGPSLASKYGAVGVIIRSVTPHSLETPHTGAIFYDDKYLKIPAASISIESADMFQRMYDNGKKIVVQLITEGHYDGKITAHNVIGEIVGSEFPNEILIIGGHIDSWENGPQTGAYDDAAGVMVCLNAISSLIKLGLRPKRTIRFIAWSGEEFGQNSNNGANAYVKAHQSEMKDHIIAFESDSGTRTPVAWGYTGDDYGYAIVKNINDLFLWTPMNITKVYMNQGIGGDIEPLYNSFKIPLLRILDKDMDKDYYFTYHHSAADSMNVVVSDDLDKNAAAIAGMFYILADLPSRIPRYQ